MNSAENQNKLETIRSDEFDLYKVETVINPETGAEGWGIVLYYDSSDLNKKEKIFSLDKGKDVYKEFLDYWCLRLNRAFVQGWSFARGYNFCYPSPEYFKQLDDLYEKWTQIGFR